jgi:hypothetical protein
MALDIRVFTRKELVVSVETQLGLQCKENALLVRAKQDWTPWGDRFPSLLSGESGHSEIG